MAALDQPDPWRGSGVARAVAGIEQKFGVGALQRLGDVAKPTTDVLPTGLVDLDRLTGIGGWPRGRICEVFGPESVGVTTLLVQTLASAQQSGGIVAFVDVDHAFVPEYARRLGCAVEEFSSPSPTTGRWHSRSSMPSFGLEHLMPSCWTASRRCTRPREMQRQWTPATSHSSERSC